MRLVQRAYGKIARKLEHIQNFYEDAVRKLEEAPAGIRQRAADQYLPSLLESLDHLHKEAKDWHSAADGLASKIDDLLPPPPPPPQRPH